MIAVAFFLVAVLYAAVGHGGASGYLAVMSLAGFAPETMKPTALILNLVVSVIGTVAFVRAGHFAWRVFWPFAAVSVPFAYLGGRWQMGAQEMQLAVAATLAFAVVRLLLPVKPGENVRPAPVWAVAVAGAVIGLLSGLVGVGGGIFLTPLLLLFRWADPKTAAAVSAPFIFVNSAAGLLGHLPAREVLPAELVGWILAAVGGGILGSRVARPGQIRPALAIASLKLLLA